MSISERLIEIRKNNGYTRTRLADELGKPYRTITNYETGEREPGHDYIIQIAKMFNVTTDYILGLSDNPHITSDNKQTRLTSNAEIIHIKKYRALDTYGQEAVSGLLETEYKRCQEQDKEKLSTPLTGDIIYLPDPIQSASAGYGQLADDDTADMIAIQANPITSKAHYIMRVSGKSMEPKFFDGQRVLVRNQPTIEPGEIGIFIIGGGRFIKTYRGDHLESTNPDYPDVPVDNYSKCIGKVLGILQDDWIVK